MNKKVETDVFCNLPSKKMQNIFFDMFFFATFVC